MALSRYQALLRRSLDRLSAHEADPGDNHDHNDDLMAGFRAYRTAGTPATERPKAIYAMKIICLSGPMNILRPLTARKLNARNLGSRKIVLKRKSTLSDLHTRILAEFPLLTGRSYSIQKSRKEKNFVLTVVEANTVQGIKAEMGRGAIYVVPDEDLDLPPGTLPTVRPRPTGRRRTSIPTCRTCTCTSVDEGVLGDIDPGVTESMDDVMRPPVLPDLQLPDLQLPDLQLPLQQTQQQTGEATATASQPTPAAPSPTSVLITQPVPAQIQLPGGTMLQQPVQTAQSVAQLYTQQPSSPAAATTQSRVITILLPQQQQQQPAATEPAVQQGSSEIPQDSGTPTVAFHPRNTGNRLSRTHPSCSSSTSTWSAGSQLK